MDINLPSLKVLAILLAKFKLWATVVLPNVTVDELVRCIAPAVSLSPPALDFKVPPPKTNDPLLFKASPLLLANSRTPVLSFVPPEWLSKPCTNNVAVPAFVKDPPPVLLPVRVIIFVEAALVLNVFAVPSATVKDLAIVAVVPL